MLAEQASFLLLCRVWRTSARLRCAREGASRFQPRRCLTVSGQRAARAPPPAPRERVPIPGLEQVTYADRMHYVPGLAKPCHPQWTRDFHDPRHYTAPPLQDMPLYKDKPCHVFSQTTSILEGVPQALWLTKSKLYPGLPAQLLSFAQSSTNRIPEQDERVQNAIRHARFWSSRQPRVSRDTFCSVLLQDLLHLCASAPPSFLASQWSPLVEGSTLRASWSRGEDLFQVRGRGPLVRLSAEALPAVSPPQEVQSTGGHALPSLSPVAPTMDLSRLWVYQGHSSTGFREDCPTPHAHTLYFLENRNKFNPENMKVKMMMFTFGSALARAHALHGAEPRVLDQPITVQAVGTNGRLFQFLVMQLNTTDLHGDQGVKNQVWLDEDALLYDFAKVRPLIKKKEVKVPQGLSGYQPETFSKFLALYLHGVM